MTPQEELQALRRMAELEEKSSGMVVREQIIPSRQQTERNRSEQLQQDKLLYSPTVGMSGTERVVAGYGKAIPDMVLGAGANLGIVPRSEVSEMRQRDAPLMDTAGGKTGNLLGNLAALAPTYGAPITSVPRAMVAGGLFGFMNPAESAGEAAWNVGSGAALSGGAQALGQAMTRPLPRGGGVTPEYQRLAAAAGTEGIPLTATQQTGNKALRAADMAFENIPSTSGRQAAIRDEQGRAFTAAALRRAGIAGDSATADVLSTQKRALGSQFSNIAGRNSVDVQSGVGANLSAIADEAERRLVPDQAGTVRRMVDDIIGSSSQGPLPGTLYQGYRSELGRLAKGNDAQAHYFGRLKRELDSAFRSQVPQADAQAWDAASRQYGNLKTIMQATGGAGEQAAGGQIAPAQLAAALRNAMSKEGVALGRGDLNELTRIGTTFLRSAPDSGTAPRMLAQAILTGGGGYVASGGDPTTALAAGAAGLAIPAAAQRILQSPAMQRALRDGIVRDPRLAQALTKSLASGALLPGLAAE